MVWLCLRRGSAVLKLIGRRLALWLFWSEVKLVVSATSKIYTTRKYSRTLLIVAWVLCPFVHRTCTEDGEGISGQFSGFLGLIKGGVKMAIAGMVLVSVSCQGVRHEVSGTNGVDGV